MASGTTAADKPEDKTGADSGGPPKRARGHDLGLLRRYWPFARPDKLWLALGLLAVPLMTGAGLAQPWLIKLAIDGPITSALKGQTYGGTWTLAAVAGAFLAAVVAEYGFRGLQLYALQTLGYQSLARLRREIFGHVLAQGAQFFDKRTTGSLLTRTITDVEALGEVLTFGIVGIVGDVVDILAILAVMVALDVKLTAMSLLVAPLIVLVVNFFRRQLRNYSNEIRRSMASAAGHYQEALAGAKIVQLHGRQATTVDEYRQLNYSYLNAYRKSNWYDASLYAVMDGVASLCIALLIWYGGGRALIETGGSGAVSVGLLVAFVQYIQRVFVPIRELSGKVATIERAFAALDRIFGILDVDQKLPSGSYAPAHIRGEIRFDDVNFAYTDEQWVLRGVSLHVPPGQVLALVGPTGSGKSTVAKLLTHMYQTPAGRVRVDDVAVEDWDGHALRRAIGVVQQDVIIFSGTLADNVDLGRGLPRARIESAIQDACLGDVAQRLGGLDARLGEAGGSLSVGERQLLSVARILAANPAVVVLDEATASIDTLTEQKLQAAIERVMVGRTAVVVAHRLSTIRKAQQIAVLQRGEVVELGNHDTLLAQAGVYAGLIASADRQGLLD